MLHRHSWGTGGGKTVLPWSLPIDYWELHHMLNCTGNTYCYTYCYTLTIRCIHCSRPVHSHCQCQQWLQSCSEHSSHQRYCDVVVLDYWLAYLALLFKLLSV